MRNESKTKISLRAARVNSGYTIEEAANWVSISIEELFEYEKDAREMPFLTALEIIKLYRFPSDVIHFGIESDMFLERN